MKKRLFALLLTAALLFTLLPQTVLFASAGTNSGTCGENLEWSFDEATGTLTITGSGEMEDWWYGDAPWYSYYESIQSVLLPDGLRGIGRYAFAGCYYLTSITIPDSVTSIENYAFYQCIGLTSVTIGNGVTSVGSCAFSECSSLYVIYNNSDLELVRGSNSDGYLAYYTNQIFDKNGTPLYSDCEVTEDGFLFTDIDSAPRLMGYCGKEESVILPSDYHGNEYSIYYMRGVRNVTIPDSVTSIGNEAFYGCIGLTAISIPDSVTSIGSNAFYHCIGLTAISIPDSVTSIGSSAFERCTGLTSITIPDGVTSISEHVFEGCESLTDIEISDSVTSIESYAFFATAYYFDSSNWTDDVLYIGNHLIEAKSFKSGAYQIRIGTKTIAGEAFYRCTGLTSITIPDSVTSIGNEAFYGCTGLTAISIPDSVTSIGGSVFSDCTGLTAISIPDSVTSIGDQAFYGCTELTTISIPDGVTSIGSRAFYGCTGLTSITVAEGNSVYDSRNNCNVIIETATNTLIAGCKNTAIPDGVTSIGDSAFSGCTGLTAISIPDSVTSIGWYAFERCTGLTAILIPDSVTSIGSHAFWIRSGLTDIYIMNTECEIEDPYEDGTTLGAPGTTTVHGYAGSTAQAYAEKYGYTFAVIDDVNDPCEGYTDIPASCWYRNAAGFVLERGIMSSTSTDSLTFAPNTPCTRSMIAQMLYSLEGKPAVTFEKCFPDVKETDWFASAVIWAYQNGVVGGYDNGKFGPNDKVTREQMAVILKAYTEKVKKMDTSKVADLSGFADANKATWSKPFIQWAVAEGLLSGKANGGKTYLDPQGNATRAEVAAIMMSFITKVVGE